MHPVFVRETSSVSGIEPQSGNDLNFSVGPSFTSTVSENLQQQQQQQQQNVKIKILPLPIPVGVPTQQVRSYG